MIDNRLKIFSPQAANIYRLLSSGQLLTAKEIANEIHILPNAVYRTAKRLRDLGFVQETKNYPVKYEAVSESQALELYSTSFQKNFHKTFSIKKTYLENRLDILFIRTREDLRENTDGDVKTAQDSVNFIVSGLEVPAETIFSYKEAIDRGVKIRALVQCLNDTSKRMFRNWKKIGVDVKYYPDMEARIFVIDSQVVYFTSYNSLYKEEAIGMRFDYTPYANIMNELFEQRWIDAKEI